VVCADFRLEVSAEKFNRMSWDSYRDTMTGSGSVKMAAVCGIEGGVWTTSPGFNVSFGMRFVNFRHAHPTWRN